MGIENQRGPSKWGCFSRSLWAGRFYQEVGAAGFKALPRAGAVMGRDLALSSVRAVYVLDIIQYISVTKQYNRARRVLGAWFQVEGKLGKIIFIILLYMFQEEEEICECLGHIKKTFNFKNSSMPFFFPVCFFNLE